jgi:hypothetical protein
VNTEGIEATKRTSRAAPGPYLGFGLQTIRLCYHLLAAPPNTSVSVEFEDDVAVHYADGSILLEQTKSAISSNPLADGAVDLWKTLANWTEWDPNPQLRTASIKYQLYVTPPKSGDLAGQLAAATTGEAVSAALTAVAKRKTSSAKAPVWQQHLRRFLTAPPATQAYVVNNFFIVSSDIDPVDPIRQFLAPTVDDEVLDDVCRQIIGYAKTESDALLRRKQPGLIAVEAFRQHVRGFLRKLTSPALFSVAPKPTAEAVEEKLRESPMFLRQLDLIDASPRQRVSSVSDYLQTIADKALWAAAGKIFQATLDRWDEDLLGLHESVCTDVAVTQKQMDALNKGKLVYVKCRQLQASIDTHVATPWFIHGSLHELANELRLGWHPDYADLL